MEWILIFAGGGIGSALRHLVNLTIPTASGADFPWATFLINLTGSFFIGVTYALGASGRPLPPHFQQAVAVGLLGGFTTFSAFSLQSLELIRSGSGTVSGLAYLVLSPVIGLACAYAGVTLGKTFL